MGTEYNSRTLRALLLGAAAIGPVSALQDARAEVVTDGTAGAAVNITGPAFEIPDTLGTTSGTNLFHSFSSFNLAAGQSATFTGPAGYSNVISRVTGGGVSTINGALVSTVPGAAFWFVNPAGVTFGQGASVNVPASFHISTANFLDFANGDRLLASTGAGSTFSSAAPGAWGFTGARTGAITVNGTGPFTAAGAPTLLLNFNRPGAVSFTTGAMAITGGASIRTAPQSPATAAASLNVDATSLTINGGYSLLTATNTAGGGAINLRVDTLSMPTGGIASLGIASGARAGNVSINATGDVTLGGGPLFFDLFSFGSPESSAAVLSSGLVAGALGGDVAINTPGAVSLTDAVVMSSTAGNGQWQSGRITVSAGSLRMVASGPFDTTQTGLYSAGGGPNAGISVSVGTYFASGAGAEIRAGAYNSGLRAGPVTVRANEMTLTNAAHITSGVLSAGDAGRIDIGVTGALSVLNGAAIYTQSEVQPGAAPTSGRPGDIVISADTLILQGRVISPYPKDGGREQAASIASNAFPGAGRSGDISITARSVQIRDGAFLSAFAFNDFGAGDVLIATDELVVTGRGAGPIIGLRSAVGGFAFPDIGAGSSLTTDSFSSGPAGTIKVTARSPSTPTTVTVDNGGVLSAGTSGSGAGGAIAICCAGSFTLSGAGSGLLAGAAAGSTGPGGRISIKSDNITFSNGASVTVASEGAGPGGEIAFQARTLTMSGGTAGSTQIRTLVSGAAVQQSAGQISIVAGDITLNDGSVLTTESSGPAPAGRIQIRASDMSINGAGTLFSSRSSGAVSSQAGNIEIHAVNLDVNDARFETLANIGGGGNISIGVDKIFRLNGVGVATNVNSGNPTDNAGAVRWGVPLPVLSLASFDTLCNFTCAGFDPFALKPAPNPFDGVPDFVSIINTVVVATNRGGGAGGDFSLRGDNIILINSILDGVSNDSADGVKANQTVEGAQFDLPNFVLVPDTDFVTPCASAAAGERSGFSIESGGTPTPDVAAPRPELYAAGSGPHLAAVAPASVACSVAASK